MEKGILETLVGVLARPASTIRSICEQRPIGWAISVYLVVGLVSTVVWIETGFLDLEGMGLPDLGMPVILVGTLVFSVVMLVVFTGICHLSASLFGGKGSYAGLFSGFAFANLPGVFAAPLAVVGMLPVVGALLAGLGSFGVVVWSLVLSILAVRENYLVSTGRAVLIILLPFVALMVLGLLVIFLMFLVG